MKINHLLALGAIVALLGETLSAQAILNPVPYKIFGQNASPTTLNDTLSPDRVAFNLLEGREFFRPHAVAVDTTADPPILYVADTGNNRVLGFRNAREVSGATQADLVIGQRSFETSTAIPLGTFSSALNSPRALAVDRDGNLFVADAGNNRILRFPRPFDRLNDGRSVHTADLVIGQPSLSTNLPNQSTATNAPPSERTIRTAAVVSGRSVIYFVALQFDREGNLWFTDAGNHRVLRYPAASLSGSNVSSGGAATEIAADLCVGQATFQSAAANPARVAQPTDRINKNLIRFPSALALDDNGNLYVSDDLARVLVYAANAEGRIENFDTQADRILGMIILQQLPGPPPPVNEFSFGAEVDGNVIAGGPRSLFTIYNRLYVVDTVFHRILRFAPFDDWRQVPEAVLYSPRAEAVFGQENLNSNVANRWQFSEPSARSMFSPLHAVKAEDKVYLADSQNNRVLVFPDFGMAPNEVAAEYEAERQVGQFGFEFRAPNLIEGREFSPSTLTVQASTGLLALTVFPSAALDRTGDRPRMFLADPGNNRVLAYSDYFRLKHGDRADFVIGQVDFFRALPNSPSMNPNQPTREGLLAPSAVAVDKAGNLYIADTGNGRVVRYQKPFERWFNGEPQEADLVLGQPDFESRGGEIGPGRIFRPTSLTVTETGKLVVADPLLNRVLVFEPYAVVDGAPQFENGQAAGKVLGQPDFESIGAGSGSNQLNFPQQIAADVDSRIYVADSGNNRVAIFRRLEDSSSSDVSIPMAFDFSLGANTAVTAIEVSRATGRIFVGDAGPLRTTSTSWTGQRVLRFADYFRLTLQSSAPELQIPAFGPRSIIAGPNDNPLIFDSANRVAFHYPVHEVRNYATESPRIAPNLIANLRVTNFNFSGEVSEVTAAPWPREMAGYELLVNGMPAPIARVSSNTIRFMVPRNTPSLIPVDFTLRRVDSGEIVAQSRIETHDVSPALIPVSIPGGGFVRALNQNGQANSSSNPARPGEEVTLFLVGYGAIDGAPEEGTAPGAEIPVVGNLEVLLGNLAEVRSSVLDPQEPGVWRIRARIPANQACLAAAPILPIAVIWRDVPNRIGPNGLVSLPATTLHCRSQ